MANRFGDWMQTYTGRRFWPFDPRPEDVDLEDIARALSCIARFGGHARAFYSVACHSLFVASLVDEPLRAHALLHDAHEAYLGDVIAPMKRHVHTLARRNGEHWSAAEDRVQRAIEDRLGLRPLSQDEREAIRYADLVALATERRDLLHVTPDRWPILDGIEPAKEHVYVLDPPQGFLMLAHQLRHYGLPVNTKDLRP